MAFYPIDRDVLNIYMIKSIDSWTNGINQLENRLLFWEVFLFCFSQIIIKKLRPIS